MGTLLTRYPPEKTEEIYVLGALLPSHARSLLRTLEAALERMGVPTNPLPPFVALHLSKKPLPKESVKVFCQRNPLQMTTVERWGSGVAVLVEGVSSLFTLPPSDILPFLPVQKGILVSPLFPQDSPLPSISPISVRHVTISCWTLKMAPAPLPWWEALCWEKQWAFSRALSPSP